MKYAWEEEMEAFEILKVAANALNEKKAKEILGVKIDSLTVLTEYFLICTAGSTRYHCIKEKKCRNLLRPYFKTSAFMLHYECST